jgi:hypothetical protein
MAVYNSVTFTLQPTDKMFRPGWEREANVSVRNIPYANKDDIQHGGYGSKRLTVDIVVLDDSGIANLQASVGSTARTLTNLFGTGDDYTNVYLLSLTGIRRHDVQAVWTATATFIQEPS